MHRDVLQKQAGKWLIVALAIASTALGGGISASASSAATSGRASGHTPPSAVLHKQAQVLQYRGAGVPTVSPRPLTGPSCSPLFSAVASPNTMTNNVLVSASAIYPTDVWGVGYAFPASGPSRTLAEHFNGTTWTTTASPNVGTGLNQLLGVAAIDTNNVWAVGLSQPGSFLNSLAVHWNGTSWAVVATPQLTTTGDEFLTSISALASNDVWASGAYANNSGVLQSLVLHWNGTLWSATTPLNSGAGDNVFEAITARSDTDIWGVGEYLAVAGFHSTTTNPYITLIEHFDGTSWTIATSTNPVSGDNDLFNVSTLSPTDVWAVGYTEDNVTLVKQALTEHLVSGVWTTVASPDIPSGDNILLGLLALSANNVWSGGLGYPSNASGGANTLVEHWDGSSWTIQTADNPGASNGQAMQALAGLPGNEVWGVGDYLPTGTTISTMTQHFQLPAPTAVSATPGDNQALVSWTAPACNGGFATTGFQVTAWDGCVAQLSFAAASSPFTFPGVTNGSPFTFTVQAVGTQLGAETMSAGSAPVIPVGATATTAFTACSNRQYGYISPNPATFVDMDATNLILVVTPAADAMALISANADLWTENTGLNQDIGINVSGGTFGAPPGTVVAWKESGGSAGTFSPNAAAVETKVPFVHGVTYTIKLQWKGNRAFPGAQIHAGAGPLPGGPHVFSPTRLTLHLIAPSLISSAITNTQYHNLSSDGHTFIDMDTANLSIPVSPAADSTAVITANVDLWTGNSGVNQDVAISVDGAIVGWKESGGAAGTFSPNAAFLQVVVPLTIAGSPHMVKLQWKANGNAPGKTIYAGAGPWPGGTTTFSPTTLLVQLFTTAADVNAKVSTQQYPLHNSDGAGWTPFDTTNLQFSFIPGVVFYSYLITGNADLWTQNAGFNQDIGIFISGGQYGTGTLVAWKESGGSAGTFSPNAAYVETVQHLNGGTNYTIWLAWKTHKQGAGATINAAAGPYPPATTTFSPTRLTALELSSP